MPSASSLADFVIFSGLVTNTLCTVSVIYSVNNAVTVAEFNANL
jgi:hypothetical protein